ncbi:MAG: DUF4340 domain-containing protein [Acidobacteria bacterium]|nr:DUF4340 domain-containing protein [Acidobacteriota bacterium]
MNELKKTLFFVLGAAVLAAAAIVVDPGASAPDIFNDQGELFFPTFTDPNAPKSIEVIDYDADTATATPLKVEFRDGQWILPSHNNYPADASDRLAKTAAALIEIKKDMIVSDRVEDHAEYGVVDPLDEQVTSLEGRGKRVTLKDGEDNVLADFVIGKAVEDKPGYRYMRVPGQRRVYAVQTQVDPSAQFRDWIETDLLKLSAADLRRVLINNYQIQEQFGMARIVPRETVELTKNSDNEWRLGSRKPNEAKMNALTGALDNLKIVDVIPKPDFLTADLKTKGQIQPSMAAARELVDKGFYLGGDGKIFGNEGEIIVDTQNGIRYTLQFGEIASNGGKQEAGEADSAGGERRFLLIAVSFSDQRAKSYAGEGKEPDAKGKELFDELQDRFAGWYYVISGADFNNLRPSKADLLKG